MAEALAAQDSMAGSTGFTVVLTDSTVVFVTSTAACFPDTALSSASDTLPGAMDRTTAQGGVIRITITATRTTVSLTRQAIPTHPRIQIMALRPHLQLL